MIRFSRIWPVVSAIAFGLTGLPSASGGIWDDPSISAKSRGGDIDFAERHFSEGLGLFYEGPAWFRNALSNPSARTRSTRSFVFDRSGDRVENGYVGTLRDLFDVGLFNDVPVFGSPSSPKVFTPTLADATPPDYYWDVNGAAVGFGGTGIWDAGTTPNWNDSTGVAAPTVWVDGNNAIFGDTAGTVTLNSAVTARSLLFSVTGYGISGSGTLTLTNTGSGGPGPATIEVQTGLTSIGNTISGTAGMTKSGAGTLILSGNNTYSGGTTVSAGLLQLNNSSALGSSSGSLTVNGGVLNLNDQSVTVGNLTGSGGTIWNNLATQAVTLTIGNGNNGGGNYAGVIADRNIGGGTGTGTVALTKTGTGTITLSGANTYTGATTVNGGTLLVTGSTASGSAVAVNNSGTLGGTGTVSGTVQVNSGGTLSPGTSPGTLTTGAVTLANGSTFAVDLTALSGNDLLVAPSVTLGTLLIGPSLSLNITGTLAMGQQFFIVNNTGENAVSGVFAQGATITSGEYTFLIDYLADFGTQSAAGGNDIMLEVTVVPEPSTWVGAALALAAIGFTQRRRLSRLVRKAA